MQDRNSPIIDDHCDTNGGAWPVAWWRLAVSSRNIDRDRHLKWLHREKNDSTLYYYYYCNYHNLFNKIFTLKNPKARLLKLNTSLQPFFYVFFIIHFVFFILSGRKCSKLWRCSRPSFLRPWGLCLSRGRSCRYIPQHRLASRQWSAAGIVVHLSRDGRPSNTRNSSNPRDVPEI